MASSVIKSATIGGATFSAPTGTSNGSLLYVKDGRSVVFSGSVQVSASLSNNTNLFSGLPTPYGGLAGFRAMCSTTGNWYDFYVSSDGTVRVGGTYTATGWYRFAGGYTT